MENITEIRRRLKVTKGDFEQKLGLGCGYFSRLSKKSGNASPSMELVSKISCYKGSEHILLDVLLEAKMVPLIKTEKTLKKFLWKLLDETRQGRLTWKVDSASSLNVYDVFHGMVPHILEDMKEPNDYGEYVYVPIAGERGDSTACDVCIHTKIDDANEIYIAKIQHNETKKVAYELHMVTNGKNPKPVCSTRNLNDELAVMLRMVYQVGKLSLASARIPAEVRKLVFDYGRSKREE